MVSAEDKPNIIFIEVDDLTYTYAPPRGSKIARTPNLDRLSREGFVFDNDWILRLFNPAGQTQPAVVSCLNHKVGGFALAPHAFENGGPCDEAQKAILKNSAKRLLHRP